MERAGEGFTRAARVLARGSALRSRRAGSKPGLDSEDLMLHQVREVPHLVQSQAQRQATASRRARRRRVLVTLMLATLTCAAVVALTPVTITLMAVPLTLLGPYLVVLRAAAKQDQRAAVQADWSKRYHASVEADYSRVTSWVSLPASNSASPAQPLSSSYPAPATPLFDAQAPDPAPPQPGEGPRWDPRVAPLPTYVHTNTLHRRSIVLGGVWESPAGASGMVQAALWEDPVEESVTFRCGPKPDGDPVIDLRESDEPVHDDLPATARAVND